MGILILIITIIVISYQTCKNSLFDAEMREQVLSDVNRKDKTFINSSGKMIWAPTNRAAYKILGKIYDAKTDDLIIDLNHNPGDLNAKQIAALCGVKYIFESNFRKYEIKTGDEIEISHYVDNVHGGVYYIIHNISKNRKSWTKETPHYVTNRESYLKWYNEQLREKGRIDTLGDMLGDLYY